MQKAQLDVRGLIRSKIKIYNNSSYLIKALLPDNSMFQVMVTILDYSIVTIYYNGKIKKSRQIPNEKLHGYLETVLYNIKPRRIIIEKISRE